MDRCMYIYIYIFLAHQSLELECLNGDFPRHGNPWIWSLNRKETNGFDGVFSRSRPLKMLGGPPSLLRSQPVQIKSTRGTTATVDCGTLQASNGNLNKNEIFVYIELINVCMTVHVCMYKYKSWFLLRIIYLHRSPVWLGQQILCVADETEAPQTREWCHIVWHTQLLPSATVTGHQIHFGAWMVETSLVP